MLLENLTGLAAYKNMWAHIHATFTAHGVAAETVKLLSTACAVPSQSLKKKLTICTAFDIPTLLKEGTDLSETTFSDLRKTAKKFYFSTSDGGYATKGLIKKTVKLAETPLEILGFDIHHKGLKTMIRTFENDSTEGVGRQIYQDDTACDSGDFGYYDGIENEGFYDQFWSGINMAEII